MDSVEILDSVCDEKVSLPIISQRIVTFYEVISQDSVITYSTWDKWTVD